MIRILPKPAAAVLYDRDGRIVDPAIELPTEDDQIMETPWHLKQMNLLIDVVNTAWKGRRYYCGGNMFLHYSQTAIEEDNTLGPDFFVVLDVPDPERIREYWCTWEEGNRAPDIIVELLSPSTARKDKTTKKEIYERILKVGEYFMFDPQTEGLEGLRLRRGRYGAIKEAGGRFWSDTLQMALGTWEGHWDNMTATWLRFYDASGKLLPTRAEAAEERERKAKLKAKVAEAKAKDAELRAESLAEANRLLKAQIDALKNSGMKSEK